MWQTGYNDREVNESRVSDKAGDKYTSLAALCDECCIGRSYQHPLLPLFVLIQCYDFYRTLLCLLQADCY